MTDPVASFVVPAEDEQAYLPDALESIRGVPNEDTAFRRTLGREEPTGYHPEVLVETSGRRIERLGLTGTLYHYLKLDWCRIRSEY